MIFYSIFLRASNYVATCINISVYAVEASDMAEQIKLVARDNKMEDRIEVVKGKVEVSASIFSLKCYKQFLKKSTLST